jgi:M6 family metalloprotease-like protein
VKKSRLGIRCVIATLALILLAVGFIPLEAGLPYLNVIAAATRHASGWTRAPTSRCAPMAPPPPDIVRVTHPTPQTDNSILSIEDPIPRTGDQVLLVVLADFPDRPGLFTGQAWQQFFSDSGGFADYFMETSYNQLRYTGDVVGLSGGTPIVNSASVAYVRLPNPITYYADGMYGFGVGFPKNSGGVVFHALQALDAAGFDFSPYANPATNKVENLVVIFAGSNFGYTRDPNNSLEATGYRLTDAGGGPYTSTGGLIFDNYTFCPDQGRQSGHMAHIGICAHEHGHALGMSDLYDLSLTTSGIGQFGLMGYGLYGVTDGQRPFHFGAFAKEFFGWITPTVVTTGTTTMTLAPAENGANFIKLYPHGNTSSQEYFLLENRQALGFDQDWLIGGLCPGLLIWHVDRNIVENYPYGVNKPPSVPGAPPHQGVIVVEADGDSDLINPPYTYYGECSDTWGTGRTWDGNSTPNSSLWDGSDSGLSVTVLSQSNDSVTLHISVGDVDLSKIFLPIVRK